MKHRFIISFSLFAIITGLMAVAPLRERHEQNLNELKWILGTWQRTNVRPGTTAFETWEQQNDQLYTGVGVSMKGSDTTFVERLRIEVKDDKIFYVADVKENATPTYFLMTEINADGFKSENPEHDFPKAIDYQLEGDNLTAIISDGGNKKMGFVFKKKP
jgi:hypothetical protein